MDGSYHEVDSSEMAFKIAASMGFKEAMKKAGPVLMEPIMAVEVVTPEDYIGDVIGDLSSRRGRIEGMDTGMNTRVVRAFVPLAEMFGYATDLRSKTSGRSNLLDAVPSLRGGVRGCSREGSERLTQQLHLIIF